MQDLPVESSTSIRLGDYGRSTAGCQFVYIGNIIATMCADGRVVDDSELWEDELEPGVQCAQAGNDYSAGLRYLADTESRWGGVECGTSICLKGWILESSWSHAIHLANQHDIAVHDIVIAMGKKPDVATDVLGNAITVLEALKNSSDTVSEVPCLGAVFLGVIGLLKTIDKVDTSNANYNRVALRTKELAQYTEKRTAQNVDAAAADLVANLSRLSAWAHAIRADAAELEERKASVEFSRGSSIARAPKVWTRHGVPVMYAISLHDGARADAEAAGMLPAEHWPEAEARGTGHHGRRRVFRAEICGRVAVNDRTGLLQFWASDMGIGLVHSAPGEAVE
ncbi:hypothetical protein CERSUDRAFT_98843 [Gelatoporia subvermispora B]|uniref:Uncharacterized protein n=1 Tax=Ceriporiopsis subvermispora (strain B) TaxID=914234 RepID=M2PC53_CERS8|nr:hypothetical protein CERSUDRAFT_98843 [Gelatoporia subvermispora B]